MRSVIQQCQPAASGRWTRVLFIPSTPAHKLLAKVLATTTLAAPTPVYQPSCNLVLRHCRACTACDLPRSQCTAPTFATSCSTPLLLYVCMATLEPTRPLVAAAPPTLPVGVAAPLAATERMAVRVEAKICGEEGKKWAGGRRGQVGSRRG